ncbi:MAG TPA: kelch repeat-containing protein [Acidimicrobiales bacterium]|nr:kelch repeat-containing protein [Acidimicrobiales bacterium]
MAVPRLARLRLAAFATVLAVVASTVALVPARAVNRPVVTGLNPPEAPERGGTVVTITGSELTAPTAVRFGDVPAASFRAVSPTTITAVSPAHQAGAVEVTVVSAGGESAPSPASRFAYFRGGWSQAQASGATVGATTSTVLASGLVLVVGGGVARNSAALFDPSSGSWAPTGSLIEGRFGHTATLLPNGRVLVTGGTDTAGNNALATAEVYDPAGGTWSAVPQMVKRRKGHTATLLTGPSCTAVERLAHCGKVLVAGGSSSAGLSGAGLPGSGKESLTDPQNAVQLFDPATATWSAAAVLVTGRSAHSATLLPDGSVLVAGGCARSDGVLSPCSSTARAETYEPITGTWRASPPLRTARAWHTATVVSGGSVLISGGGVVNTGVLNQKLASAELYDPLSGSSATGSMGLGRMSHTATLLSGPGCGSHCGKVLVLGGDVPINPADLAPGSAELYDPGPGTWSTAGRMRADRAYSPGFFSLLASFATVGLADGRVLAAGGTGSASPDVFDPSGALAPPIVAELDPRGGSTLGGTRITLQGSGFFSETLRVDIGGHRAIIEYVSDAETIVLAPPSAQGQVQITVATVAGAAPQDSWSRFTYGEGTWTATGALDACAGPSCSGRYNHTGNLLDPSLCRKATPPPGYPCGSVLVTGGTLNLNPVESPSALASTELYDPATRSWRAGSDMSVGRHNHSATMLDGPKCRSDNPPTYCGRLLVVGGQDARGAAIRSAELYDPIRSTWRSCPTGPASPDCPAPPARARMSATATLLDGAFCTDPGHGGAGLCGDVVVAGGNTTYIGRPALKTVEIYDPDTGTWSNGPDLQVARGDHVAVMLGSGAILVTGGLTSIGEHEQPAASSLSSTELYEAGGSVWQSCSDALATRSCPGPMAVERFLPAAAVLDTTPCGDGCGKVLVFGGANAGGPTNASELYDPGSGRWAPAGLPPEFGTVGATANVLADGKVLVAGGGPPFDGTSLPTVRHALVYDPQSNAWRNTDSLSDARGRAIGVLLSGPACRTSTPPEYCATVLLAGGGGRGRTREHSPLPLSSAEIYVPAPTIRTVTPSLGPTKGGTTVAIDGSGFLGATAVAFGGINAQSFDVVSADRLTAVAPAHVAGPVEVTAVNRGGTSAVLAGARTPFRYEVSQRPGRITDLTAIAISASKIGLAFSAPPSDGAFPPPSSRYVVKQSASAMTDEASFAEGLALCLPEGACSFSPIEVGQQLTLDVDGLAAGTRYHYAVRAVNGAGLEGPLSNDAAATTLPETETSPVLSCPNVNAGDARPHYPAGYSLVGVPGGTLVGSQSPLYGWFDQGAGASYATAATPEPGRGYWAWFACPHVIDLPASDATPMSFPLGAYHASMLGNPSATSATSVSGHDFAALWDPALNGGVGGYHISAYSDPQSLAVGAGAWVFSYVPTQIVLSPPT